MKNSSNHANKENRMSLERRLSLKYSSTNLKNNPRNSVPIRRQSLGTLSAITTKNQPKQPRQSIISIKSQVLSRPVKKQAIITNLVNKLEYEDDLKTIIESKIKRSISRNDTTFCGDDAHYLAEKLQTCEQQIDSFKDLVRQLTEKISMLQGNSCMKNPIKIDFQKDKVTKFKQCGIQTEDNIRHQVYVHTQNTVPDIQFLDNLDKTLKVLSHKKKL